MKLLATLLLSALLLAIMSRDVGARTVEAARSDEPIRIDGLLDEPIWQRPANGDFTQFAPEPGAPASERTDVWVAYDDEALYVAARLYDRQPEAIARNFGRRDAPLTSDWFWVAVDAYHDRRSGFIFVVNPAGSIRDGILFDDTERDDSWDGIWERATNVDSGGWSVELRIPYSQLRFEEQAGSSTWGVNFGRVIRRTGEDLHFAPMPRNEVGYVSRFAALEGLRDISPPQRLELTPYVVAGGRFLRHADGDPFVTGRDPFATAGADLKVGIGSSLTLDGTINPDFGQVEVDPAVLNLSQFETFFQEKRPFFVEGSGIFSFARDNGNYGWLNQTFFYSRRIGRAPQGYPEHEGFVDYPDRTTILGAGKLTGRVGEGWSLGLLSAATAREHAEVDSSGTRFLDEVEPLTFYNVLRTRREFDRGMQGVGLMATATNRELRTPGLEQVLASAAYSGGLDGWSYLDERRDWLLSGWGGVTHVMGSREMITSLQQAPQRYFQRPDADHLSVDPDATSLTGWSGRVQLRKAAGNLRLGAAVGAISPGFETNDIGYGRRVDYINGALSAEYHWFEPDGLFRYKWVGAHAYQSNDFGGTALNAAYGFNLGGELESFWGFDMNLDYTPLTYDTRSTRGGPMIDGPAGWFGGLSGYSDGRKPVQVSAWLGGSRSPGDIWGFWTGASVTWRPNEQIVLQVGPEWNRDINRGYFVGSRADALATETFGRRYLFADLVTSRISADIRLDWAFSPELSLQLYAQPFFAVGQAASYKELARPSSYDFHHFGSGASTLEDRGDHLVADPDGEGPAEPIALGKADFNYKSLRGTAVLRWEYRPGSTVYLVWTHSRDDFADPGRQRLGHDFGSLLDAEGDDILMLKVAYWIGS